METDVTHEHEQYPTLSDRVQSTFIDTLLIVLMMFVIAAVLERYSITEDWIRIVLFISIWCIYEPLCLTLGYTLGNLIKGIRVRSASNNNRRINFLQALMRYIIKLALGWISFLTIHSNSQRRAIHDLVVGSVMIRK
jgi:uncharacterized RDD family membrane protein YckC